MLTRDDSGSYIDWYYLNRYTVGFDSEHMPADAKTEGNYRDYVMGVYDGIPKTEKQFWLEQMTEVAEMQADGSFKLIATVTQEDLDRYGAEGAPQEGMMPLEEFL